MSVEVVVPWLSGCAHRERALRYVRARYLWPVTLAPSPTPFCKGAALNAAVLASSADVIVAADADCFTEGIESAVMAVTCGAGEWAVPHAPDVHRLSEDGTAAVLRGESWEGQPLDELAYQGVVGGGIVVGMRETFLEVPIDPRFIGFAREDYCWGLALRTLIGEPWRGSSPLVHLWHPPQERLDRKWGSVESYRLTKRYHTAARRPDAMQALLAEFDQGDTRNDLDSAGESPVRASHAL